MAAIHRDLAAGRWTSMSLVEQLANIGSEVSRCLAWRRKGNEAIAGRAFQRALELFDLTLDAGHPLPRLREVCRAREVVCDYIAGDNAYHSTPESLERYFLAFAVLARRQAGR